MSQKKFLGYLFVLAGLCGIYAIANPNIFEYLRCIFDCDFPFPRLGD